MIVLLWIVGIYIGGIFLARYLNFLINKMEDSDDKPLYGMWFIPIIGPLFALVVCVITYFEVHNPAWLKWFKGDDW